MFNTAAQSIKKAPQQAARIQRNITSDAFAFYPVRKTRYDQVIPTSMFQVTTQATKKASQQQVARLNTSAAQAERHSYAFYPIQKNRVRMVTPKTNRDCYGYYPINVVREPRVPSVSIKDVKAVREILRKRKQATKLVKNNWDSVFQEMKAVKKAMAA